jgi:hypothetical protein
VYIQFFSKSSVPYTIGSVFLVAIQRYMACLIWKKNLFYVWLVEVLGFLKSYVGYNLTEAVLAKNLNRE